MAFLFNLEKNQFFLSGEMTIMEIESITRQIKENISHFSLSQKITLNLENLEKIDSSGIQLLLSLQKTYPEKVIFSNIPHSLKTLFSRHGFKFSPINSNEGTLIK